ncbi:MAG: Asp-tRNA(Asn)/Glu-tRNA(Gln) amidotransferase subunit GatC [Polyangiaceae bacterium]|nr:Asp-tRNA(Asn)/Glu-tRNA(Gln) amidotransferase subunit GatC [Polyangiaceae bacterium]
MSLDRETVARVARLARIELSDSELEGLVRDLERIVAYVDEIGALPLEAVPPTAHAPGATLPLRPDAPLPCLDREVALAEAPRQAESAFAVPEFVTE